VNSPELIGILKEKTEILCRIGSRRIVLCHPFEASHDGSASALKVPVRENLKGRQHFLIGEDQGIDGRAIQTGTIRRLKKQFYSPISPKNR
jgi:hypothetical protein